MPSRSLIIQLQPGQSQAILPDHRKMLPGIQYVIDWNTFEKLSLGARQNVIQIVGVNNDSTTASTSFVPAQTATGPNSALNIQTILSTTTANANTLNLAGFSAQGWTANSAGPTGVSANNTINFSLTGPTGERYTYVQNVASGIAAGQVVVWADEVNRFVTTGRPTYQVFVDGQGTQYQASVIDSNTSPATIGTKQGRFAGVANVAIASGYYGWVQIEGYCPSVQVTGTVLAGSTLAVSTTSGTAAAQAATATVYGPNNSVTGSPLANNVFGTALTSGTNTNVAAHLRSVNRPKMPYNRFLNRN